MFLQIQPPNWADILQGIGAIIGVPGAIAAFVILFTKDRHKLEQIESLTSIAQKLEQSNENKQLQIDSLKEISIKIEAQNETLQMSNELASEQIDVLRKMLLSPGTSGFEKLAEIEEKKLKLSVMPNLKSNSQSYRMEEFSVNISNHGETAIIEKIDFLDSEVYPHNNLKVGYELEKEKYISIGGRSKNRQNTNYMDYKIDVYFKDKLNNKFVFRIERKLAEGPLKAEQIEI
jgi:hypothetical protein